MLSEKERQFQTVVQEAANLIWKHRNAESAAKGQANLSKAADMAWAKLGHCYEHGMGTHSDKEKSLACYKKGAELGDYGAIYALARNCRAADGIWLDIKRAMGYLHRVVSEENIWQNPARVLMAQAFLAQHPGKFVHRAEELLQIVAKDTGMLELADCFKKEGQMDRYRLALEARAMCRS